MNKKKKVSILMGVYNCESTLVQAVNSIIYQTYPNWELIICDDGSTDRTLEIAYLMAKKDGRIIVINNERNLGLNFTLNHCLEYASGQYIARMDGDDESLPERFEKQVAFLEEHPEYAIVSSSMVLFDENGEWGRTTEIEFPSKEDVVCGCPIRHAPMMLRKECMEAVGGYTVDPRMIRVEDVNLFIKLYHAGFQCYNFKEPLYRMRNDQNALNRRKYRYRINSTYVRIAGCKMMNLGVMCYLKAITPMIVGLIPSRVRQIIRRYQYKK